MAYHAPPGRNCRRSVRLHRVREGDQVNGKSTFTAFSDQVLEAEIVKLESAIEKWARSHDLWHDCAFTTYLDHFDAEPASPIVSMLCFEGPLYNVFGGHTD